MAFGLKYPSWLQHVRCSTSPLGFSWSSPSSNSPSSLAWSVGYTAPRPEHSLSNGRVQNTRLKANQPTSSPTKATPATAQQEQHSSSSAAEASSLSSSAIDKTLENSVASSTPLGSSSMSSVCCLFFQLSSTPLSSQTSTTARASFPASQPSLMLARNTLSSHGHRRIGSRRF
ncbi:unnamed protein product [Fusarium graminearum]|nr:unnamed protein product [Fusarium graminearum]CAG2000301.1 unnamed protein product [Fusarium graminearum]